MSQYYGNEFRFGIEIELLIGGRKTKYMTWDSLARDLSKRLVKAGIPNHINNNNDKSKSKYNEWSIAREVTVHDDPVKHLFGLELISPIFTPHSPWTSTLTTLFTTLTTSFSLVPSPQCATHIHLSRSPTPLSPADLAALARAALVHEPALDTLFPSHRQGHTPSAYWARSNRFSPALQGLSLAQCLDALTRAAEVASHSGNISCAPVVEVMNLFPRDSPRGRALRKTGDFVHGKGYKWDFTSMLGAGEYDPREGGGRGTVEYRQPPGSVSAAEVGRWVRLAVMFVAGAVSGGDGAVMEELWEVLERGKAVVGWETVVGVEELFAGVGR